MAKSEKLEFQTEVSQLLKLMINSVYSEKEVFVRELVSNASDACDKLRYLATTKEKLLQSDPDLKIQIEIDKKENLITITDNGIGMNRDDLVNNLGTIARSGTAQFIKEATETKDLSLIGQFGVGFYSAFMVASDLTVITRKAGEKKLWIWKSDGESNFTIDESDDLEQLNSNRGTKIILSITKEGKEYLEKIRIEEIIRKYSDHISIPIFVRDIKDKEDEKPEAINSALALWTRPKNKITKEQYKEFYNHVGQMFDDPWLTSHYKAEGQIEYTVLNFIPSTKPFDLYDPARENRLKLYVKKVFITDNCPELIPPYLRFLRGVIDSEDLPLNISREMLQNNPVVKKIRNALVRRTIGDLKKKLTNDRTSYEEFWSNFGPVIKEGIYEDTEKKDTLLEIALFKNSNSTKLITLDEYIDSMSKKQKDIYFITGDSYTNVINNPSLEGYKSRGINVLILDDAVDSFWTSSTPNFKEKNIKSVSKGVDDLESISKKKTDDKDKKEDKSLEPLIILLKDKLKDKVKDVRTSSRLTESPVCLVVDESAMDPQLEKILQQHNQLQQGAALKILEINPDHKLIKKLAKMSKDKASVGDIENIGILLYEQSMILDGEKPSDPVSFSKKLIDTISASIS
ncbi:molecular chaperone HtpG [Pelagibacterales bacterium]|nr:molecular chaperone HtpG [Pelagibacteraceae bacterium]MDA9980550.1 molecular chaperone HtpG [Pelagibacterales bacterium]